MNKSVNIKNRIFIFLLFFLFPTLLFSKEWGGTNNDGSVDIIDALLISKVYVGLIDVFPVSATQTPAPGDYLVTDIPEWSSLTDFDWARGLGGGIKNSFSGGGEENFTRESYDLYLPENIGVHEFGHSFYGMIYHAEPALYTEIENSCNDASSRGLRGDTYAASNMYEYFAEGVRDRFNVNDESSSGNPDGIHNHVNTRKELWNYDIRLYNVLAQVFDPVNLPPPWDIS